MSIFIIIAVVLSVFLALNIGANNAAASMATSYGAGVRTKRQAVILIAIFALLTLLTYAAFRLSDVIMTKVGPNLILVIGKIMGLILAIIGMDMITDGIKLSFDL